jgi:hypothetical protein
MRFTPVRFRLRDSEASALDALARKHHISKSTLVRVICLFGPLPATLYPEGGAFVMEGPRFCNAALLNGLRVETVRQSTNARQASAGFAAFLRGVGIEDVSEENIFADPERRPTMEAISARLASIASVVEEVSIATSNFSRDSAAAMAPLSGFGGAVSVRLESVLYDMLCLRAEAFGISARNYVRFCIPYLPELVLFARERVTEDAVRFEPLCLRSVDLDSMTSRFRECGRVLNDAARYLNTEMLGYYKLSEIVLMLELRCFLGKLDVASGFYRCFCDEFGFRFEE